MAFYFIYECQGIFRSNITLRPSVLKSDTSTIVNKVKAGEDKKIRKKMKEKPKTEFKEETESRRVKAKVKVKNAKVKASHAHFDGLNMVKVKSLLIFFLTL